MVSNTRGNEEMKKYQFKVEVLEAQAGMVGTITGINRKTGTVTITNLRNWVPNLQTKFKTIELTLNEALTHPDEWIRRQAKAIMKEKDNDSSN